MILIIFHRKCNTKSTGGRSKNGIFRVYTVKNDRNRHKNGVICGPSLCFVSHICSDGQLVN